MSLRIDVQEGDYPAPPSIEVTPELARQIVALGETEHSHPATSEAIFMLQARIAALEQDGYNARIKNAFPMPQIKPQFPTGDLVVAPVDAGPALSMREQMRLDQHGIEPLTTTPPADDAAVRVIVDAMRNTNGRFQSATLQDMASAILAAIRRGEVPGITAISNDHIITGMEAQIAALRTEVERLTRERDGMNATICANAEEMNRAVGWRSRFAAVQARVAELEAKLAQREQIIESALRELPVGNMHTHTADSIPGRIAHYVEESARLDRAEAERDEARAEMSALKGRKVKLPLMYGEPDKGDPPDMAHGWKMYDDAVEACAAAIRAAGVEVADAG